MPAGQHALSFDEGGNFLWLLVDGSECRRYPVSNTVAATSVGFSSASQQALPVCAVLELAGGDAVIGCADGSVRVASASTGIASHTLIAAPGTDTSPLYTELLALSDGLHVILAPNFRDPDVPTHKLSIFRRDNWQLAADSAFPGMGLTLSTARGDATLLAFERRYERRGVCSFATSSLARISGQSHIAPPSCVGQVSFDLVVGVDPVALRVFRVNATDFEVASVEHDLGRATASGATLDDGGIVYVGLESGSIVQIDLD
jgi:hypothetical protein